MHLYTRIDTANDDPLKISLQIQILVEFQPSTTRISIRVYRTSTTNRTRLETANRAKLGSRLVHQPYALPIRAPAAVEPSMTSRVAAPDMKAALLSECAEEGW